MPHSPSTILITGAAGFVGTRLAGRLAAEFPEAVLVGTDLLTPNWTESPTRRVTALDITDPDSVRACFREHQPDCIVHLAAQSHVPTSFEKPILTWHVNLMGTLHLLEAARTESPGSLFVFISSSEVYGRQFNTGRPVDEQTPLAPMNPYAASKAAADTMVRQALSDAVHTIVLRPFNHVGPGQRQDFVVSAFSSQIAKIEHGLQDPVLHVGNLEAQRDFLDIRDVLDAYTRVIRVGRDHDPGTVWNLCTGRPVTIQSVLDDLLALSDTAIAVRIDSDRLRPSEVPVALGDASKARKALDWEPSTPWSTTLADTLDYWRDIKRP